MWNGFLVRGRGGKVSRSSWAVAFRNGQNRGLLDIVKNSENYLLKTTAFCDRCYRLGTVVLSKEIQSVVKLIRAKFKTGRNLTRIFVQEIVHITTIVFLRMIQNCMFFSKKRSQLRKRQ
jgi:hypothetical protein